MQIEVWQLVLYIILALIAGAAAGFFVTRHLFQKQLKENPPINEKMIRAMFRSMGRAPSEKQVREIMRNVNSQR
ncbi:MAG: YneF family protein [Bacilli bacterium]|nr:YneF family protein [Bacilli bacterium]